MAKKEKEICAYQDTLGNDVEILGSTQVRSAPGTFQSTASSRPNNRTVTASSERRHRYNYRDDNNAEDGKYDFFAYPQSGNNEEDLSDVKVVEKSNPKNQRRRVGTANRKGKCYPGDLCQGELC